MEDKLTDRQRANEALLDGLAKTFMGFNKDRTRVDGTKLAIIVSRFLDELKVLLEEKEEGRDR